MKRLPSDRGLHDKSCEALGESSRQRKRRIASVAIDGDETTIRGLKVQRWKKSDEQVPAVFSRERLYRRSNSHHVI